jgi:hypothetical protein
LVIDAPTLALSANPATGDGRWVFFCLAQAVIFLKHHIQSLL